MKRRRRLLLLGFLFFLLGIITHLRPVNRRHFWLAGWLALLGCSKVVWFYWDYLGQPHFDPYNDYLNAGKRLLIAAVIGYYLFSQQERLPQLTRRMVEWGLIVAFVGATVYGFTNIQMVPGALSLRSIALRFPPMVMRCWLRQRCLCWQQKT